LYFRVIATIKMSYLQFGRVPLIRFGEIMFHNGVGARLPNGFALDSCPKQLVARVL
jgi:hypothetical protein